MVTRCTVTVVIRDTNGGPDSSDAANPGVPIRRHEKDVRMRVFEQRKTMTLEERLIGVEKDIDAMWLHHLRMWK